MQSLVDLSDPMVFGFVPLIVALREDPPLRRRKIERVSKRLKDDAAVIARV